MSEHTVDVVMTVYNADRYLHDAVSSILHQTYRDFRLVCVDDGSTDTSPEILERFAAGDARVQIIRQTNQGVVGAANAGVAACTAPLLARMDADDISMPTRFERQVEFLAKHPEVAAVGTNILEIDADSQPLATVAYPSEHEAIDRANLQLRTSLANPSTMIRRDALNRVGGYREDFPWGEDLDLWLRLAEHARLANLPEILLCYRQHTGSVSWSHADEKSKRLAHLLRTTYARRGLDLPESLMQKCMARRSPSGPLKWARKAARQGHWEIALKHLRTQWRTSPMDALTWRMSVEVAARSAASCLLGKSCPFPKVPRFADAR